MKICIARLRSGINYTKPLEHIMDSYCYMLKKFVDVHPEFEFSYYNFGFNTKPVRDNEALKNADIIIVPSEAEFTYHIKGKIHTKDLEKSNQIIKEIEPFFNGKKIINLRSDRRDDLELYQKTFPNISFDYAEIDETDFPGNIHCLKSYFIKRENKLFNFPTEKKYQFAYWGSDKRKGIDGKNSGDVRYTFLKDIKKSDIQSIFIGNFYGFQRDMRWDKLINLFPYLGTSQSTACFNWMDPTATTARYAEAIAFGMVPFAHERYDIEGKFVKTDWQRFSTSEELIDKIKNLKYNYSEKFEEVENAFLKGMPSVNEYYVEFERKLLWILN